MARIAMVGTAGAGGDLQPLVATALALRERGHELAFMGDVSTQRLLAPLGVAVEAMPSTLDLGPRLVAAVREGMATGNETAAAAKVRERMTEWAKETASWTATVLRESRADAVVTSLFGVEVLSEVAPACPWAVVNSTFYIGREPPRPLIEDFAPRAVPLIERFASLLGAASLVLHATDREFDLSFVPPRGHHYVGPLGIWEPPSEPPAYLAQTGDPWVLVSISSQLQDDIPIAQAAVTALADEPMRVLVTVGPDHDPSEIADLPGNARVERVVSHSAVLERGALLVSHAGHGSVMKALWHGRPMVLVPWSRDQPGVAARAAELGVCEVVQREGISPDVLASAVRRVLGDARMRETAASHGSRLRETDPGRNAAAAIESLI